MTAEKNILEGPKIDPLLSEKSLGEITLLMLANHGDQVLQVDGETNEELPAYLIQNRSIHLAKWFQARNIGVGDSVSVNSENRLEFCIPPVACFLLGVTFAPLNPDYTPGELKHVLNLSKPKIIFCSERTIEKMISILPDHPYIQNLVLFGKRKTVKSDKVIFFEDIIRDAPKEIVENHGFVPYQDNPHDTVATILCSSGTTGLPKGVMCTHANMTVFLDIGRILFASYANSSYESDIAIGLGPFFHSMGFMVMYLSLLRGRKLVVFSRFSPKHFLEALERFKISRIQVAPPVLLFLTKHPLVKKYDLSNLTDVISGAAPLSKETEEHLMQKFPSVRTVSQGYGLTETTLSVLLNPIDKPKSGSVGTVVPGMKCKVINENGEALGPYQEGELCFKGPLIMKGYIGDPKATAETIDRDGWLHTGDVAYYDKDGYFFIVDRIKELIKYNGFQVAPAELEALLIEHPDVVDAAVVGLPDEIAGELPLAYIVKEPGSKVTAEDLKKYIADKVSPQKRLRGGVHFINEIPRNPSGKILRRVLRDQSKKLKSKL